MLIHVADHVTIKSSSYRSEILIVKVKNKQFLNRKQTAGHD